MDKTSVGSSNNKKRLRQTLLRGCNQGTEGTASNKRKLEASGTTDVHNDTDTDANTNDKSFWKELGSSSRVGYWPQKITHDIQQQAFDSFMKEVSWQQKDVLIMGKRIPQPRLISYHALDTSKVYKYSGLEVHPQPFTPLLSDLKAVVEQLSGTNFNSVLLNYYRNGADCVGWHSDDEKLYGPEPVIASISLGATRDFIMRRKDDHSTKLKFSLAGGDVLVMAGTTQKLWQHCVPRRMPADKIGPRISLTFRRIVDL